MGDKSERMTDAFPHEKRGVLSDYLLYLDRPVVPLGKERLQTEHQPIQTRQPFPKFIIELLVGAPLRKTGIEVVPVGHRPDCDLSNTSTIPTRDI